MGIVQFLTDLVNLALPLALGALLDASGFSALGIFFVVAFTAAAIIGACVIASTPLAGVGSRVRPGRAGRRSRAAARGLTGLALLIAVNTASTKKPTSGRRCTGPIETAGDANPDQLEKASPQS